MLIDSKSKKIYFVTNTSLNNFKKVKPKLDIAVIGSGLAGLSLARELSPKHRVTIYEKDRSVGGRLASRKYIINNQEEHFDFGAQFFYAKKPRFKALLEEAMKRDALTRWDGTFAEIQGNKVLRTQAWDANYPHYVGNPTMNSFAQFLANGLDIKLNSQVSSIKQNNDQKWQLLDENGNIFAEHEWLVIACPAQQVVQLSPLNISFRQEIDQERKMLGCYTMMLAFEQELDLPFQCALVRDANISWVSQEHSKPNRGNLKKLVIHATNKWSEENMQQEIPKVLEYMIGHSSDILGVDLKSHIFADVNRCYYANISRSTKSNFYMDRENKVAAIGDWCVQGRAEAAFTSAINCADALEGNNPTLRAAS